MSRDGSHDISHDKTLLSDARPLGAGPTFQSSGQTFSPTSEGQHPTALLDGATPDLRTLPSADAVTKGSSPPPARHDVQPGQVLSGRYALERVLGQGGMGKVWKGVHLGLGVPIAVKTMHPEIAASNDYARRFQREAHAASLIDHPNVVRVLDFGEDQGTLYMVMEYLEGRSMTRWLGSLDAPPPLAQVGRILMMLLDAFEVAHAFGIVHRDLKPDNVFVLSTGADRLHVKVVDFGLAHVDDARDQGPTLTNRDVVAGTPEYMSPEQCRSLAVGPSADIYSLGCLLTDMLQLRPPFSGGSAIEVLAKQMFTHPPPLSRPDGAEVVPPLLERLRLDLLAKSPEKRPRDAADVKARLREALSPEATEARLPTRKGDEPLGDRASRAPQWHAGAHAESGEGAPPTTRTRARAVALLRLTRDEGGVGGEVETGLSVHKLETVTVSAAAGVPGTGLGVVVVDAGARIDEAAAALRDLLHLIPRCRVLVCASDLTTEKMNALVAAGAADVLRYPVSADALSRKLERVLRRGR
jgi:serine/threonine-protein kinase